MKAGGGGEGRGGQKKKISTRRADEIKGRRACKERNSPSPKVGKVLASIPDRRLEAAFRAATAGLFPVHKLVSFNQDVTVIVMKQVAVRMTVSFGCQHDGGVL